MIYFALFLLFALPAGGYVIGRAHGRLLHSDHEVEAELQGYEKGFQHGHACGCNDALEAALMAVHQAETLPPSAAMQRRGIVLQFN